LTGLIYEQAACDQSTQVVLPMLFDDDDDDDDACARCAREVRDWMLEPAMWWQRRRQRDAARQLREEEQEDVAHWRGRHAPG
jgi:hypothetical protein